MGSRGLVVAVFAVLAALVVGWLWSSSRHAEPRAVLAPASPDGGPEPLDPLSAVPRGALLIATVDVEALRNTTLGERLIGRGRRVGGLGLVSDVCGSDPMAGVERLAITIPSDGEAAFAVTATGAVDADALLRCAARVIERRGGRPVASPMGRFRVLRDVSVTEPGGAELAVATGGPVILAPGAYLRAAVDAAEGRLESVRASVPHRELRAAVGDGVIVVTVVLTPELRRTLAQELVVQGAEDSPASAILSAGLSLRVGDMLDGHAVLRCDRAEPCRAIAKVLDEARRRRLADLSAHHPTLAALLRDASIRARGTAVHGAVSIPASRGLDVLDGLLALWAADSPRSAPPPGVGAGGGSA
ncbi:MAG: hypothetical protein JRI23_11255, partial [Deltaproteobacteria bacterium]|nr:hypothetical protein [Deltaproteobacteria bacterium]MBW2532272.1 hypothetical protein [Deltaproteobacteria bacterium]